MSCFIRDNKVFLTNFLKRKIMNKKIKKTLKWTSIIRGAGLGGALIASAEFRGAVMEKAMAGFKAVKGIFTTEDTKTAVDTKEESAPKKEGRNGGYYKPRYNNNNKKN
jgi:hypothetical protein